MNYLNNEIDQEEFVEDDFSNVSNDAMFRLEQGRLYKMIMDNDIFSGTDADAQAVKYVTHRLRSFAKEQMEIMLGMRQESVKESAVSSPFNELEVRILKQLASKVSKGASEESQPAPPTQPKQGLTPISVAKPTVKKQAPAALQEQISKITGSKPPTSQTQKSPTPLAKPVDPVKRAPRDGRIISMMVQSGIPIEEYDRHFGLNSTLPKPIEEMTDQELIEWQSQANKVSYKKATAPATYFVDEYTMQSWATALAEAHHANKKGNYSTGEHSVVTKQY